MWVLFLRHTSLFSFYFNALYMLICFLFISLPYHFPIFFFFSCYFIVPVLLLSSTLFLSFLLSPCLVHSPLHNSASFPVILFLSFSLIQLFWFSILISPSIVYFHHVYFQTPYAFLYSAPFPCYTFSWMLPANKPFLR